MPLYGQSFSLAERDQNGLNAPTYGGGEAGEETMARGFLAYYEICSNVINKGWTVVRDVKGRMGPYAYKGDQWVSFDDIGMIRHKSQYIKAMGLGGGMIWALDLDDFKDLCGCEEYPLLRTINRVLRGYSKPAPKCILGKTPPKKPITPIVTHPTTEVSYPTDEPEFVAAGPLACGGRLFVAHETNCNEYYLCNQGLLQLQVCPSGLYWNQDHCDWPENTPCHPDSTTPAQEELTGGNSVAKFLPSVEEPWSSKKVVSSVDTGPYKVVCYFTNWAWYREGNGKYLPRDIDPKLCTHINYAFAVLDDETLTIKPHNSWEDVENEFYKQVTQYRSSGVKVLIALGGWNDSHGDKYSRLVNDPQARARFIQHVLKFIQEYGFDGLNLDWYYPKCWQVDCAKGPESDKAAFASFVCELSNAFKPHGLLLSAGVSPSKPVIDAGYDVPTLSQYLDWISVMTYDYHGHWDKQTGHVAPLYYYPGDDYDYFNANFSMHYWIEKGAKPEKLVMGMPFYGQSFNLVNAEKHGINAKSRGPGQPGEFTKARGFLAFYEICENVNRRGWMVKRDPQGRIGPYAHEGNQWVSYDDIAEIKMKSRFVKEMGLGGGTIWALDLDDFRNLCGCGKYPLLTTLNHELRGTPSGILSENCT